MKYIFVLTLGVVLLNMITIIAHCFKVDVTMPTKFGVNPRKWWIFYPSFFFQVYWWSIFIGLIK